VLYSSDPLLAGSLVSEDADIFDVIEELGGLNH
jgi:hypothetical protein